MKKIVKFYDTVPERDILFFGDGAELHYYLPEEFDGEIQFEVTNLGNLKVTQKKEE